MVDKLAEEGKELKTLLQSYVDFLQISVQRINKKVELDQYIKYVINKKKALDERLDNLDKEDIEFIDGAIGAIARFFSEFSWHPDIEFSYAVRKHLDNLTQKVITLRTEHSI